MPQFEHKTDIKKLRGTDKVCSKTGRTLCRVLCHTLG